jgi:hypothetical protein
MTRDHSIMRRRATASFLCLSAAICLGCPLGGRPATRAEPPPSMPGSTADIPPPDSSTMNPPTEVDLAIRAAEDAEARADYEMALELYDWAYMAQSDRRLKGDIHYRVARLRADPRTRWRDVEQARREFEAALAISPEHPRAREARLFVALIAELELERVRAASLRIELEGLRSDRIALKEELDRKDQELRDIKEVLLEKNP